MRKNLFWVLALLGVNKMAKKDAASIETLAHYQRHVKSHQINYNYLCIDSIVSIK